MNSQGVEYLEFACVHKLERFYARYVVCITNDDNGAHCYRTNTLVNLVFFSFTHAGHDSLSYVRLPFGM
jgi:hypothetical protein